MPEQDIILFQGFVEAYSDPRTVNDTVDTLKSASWLILDATNQIALFDSFKCVVSDSEKDAARYGEAKSEADIDHTLTLSYGDLDLISLSTMSRANDMKMLNSDFESIITGPVAVRFGLHVVRELRRLDKAGKIRKIPR